MKTESLQLQPITPQGFYAHWTTKKADTSEGDAILHSFKPVIEAIPKLVLGEYYWQIFDNATSTPKILMVGGAVEKLTSFSPDQLLNATAEEFFTIFHPDDLNQALTFVSKVFDMLFSIDARERKNYNITIYTRIKNNEGNYIWNSLQYPALYFDENGDFLYGLALYTNVNHLRKATDQPMLTILDSTNKKNQIFTCYTPQHEQGIKKTYPILTKREREIVILLSQGMASKQICDRLGIKKNTVDNHRQRLLKKFEVKSSAELVIKALIS